MAGAGPPFPVVTKGPSLEEVADAETPAVDPALPVTEVVPGGLVLRGVVVAETRGAVVRVVPPRPRVPETPVNIVRVGPSNIGGPPTPPPVGRAMARPVVILPVVALAVVGRVVPLMSLAGVRAAHLRVATPRPATVVRAPTVPRPAPIRQVLAGVQVTGVPVPA